jgi:hypothetical protein
MPRPSPLNGYRDRKVGYSQLLLLCGECDTCRTKGCLEGDTVS